MQDFEVNKEVHILAIFTKKHILKSFIISSCQQVNTIREKNQRITDLSEISYTDGIIILLNFLFTHLHGYQITPGLSTNKQRHCLLL